LCLVFVLTLPLLNPWVCGDGVGYYAFVRAQLIEHNLDFTEDYRHANQSFREPRIDENACQLLAAVRSCVSKRLRHLQVPPQALSMCIKSLKIYERYERCQLDKLRAGGHNSGRPRRRRNSLASREHRKRPTDATASRLAWPSLDTGATEFRLVRNLARSKNMKIATKWILVTVIVTLAGLLSIPVWLPVARAAADHVRWDIIHMNPATTPNTLSPGGVAFASARNPGTLSIKLTGSGTFRPDDPEEVTGGGTWETFSDTTSTGSGTYEVRKLVSWQFARLGLGNFIEIGFGDGTAANGNAVLRIRYSDGGEGVFGIGCEGPGPGIGILEGVIATKDHVTYWDAQAPMAGVDANRTLFHISNSDE